MQTTSTPPVTPLAVRPREAAKMLGISQRTLHTLIRSGQIHARKIGGGRAGAVLIRVADLEAYLAGEQK